MGEQMSANDAPVSVHLLNLTTTRTCEHVLKFQVHTALRDKKGFISKEYAFFPERLLKFQFVVKRSRT